MQGYIPGKIALIRAWLLNIFTVLPVQGLLVGQTATQITATRDIAQAGMTKIDAVVAAKAAQKAAVKDYNTWAKTNGAGLAVIKKSVEQYKADPGYTSEIGAILKVIGTHEHFDPTTYKPTGTATPQAGYNLVKFDKHGVDLMSVNYRVIGSTTWIHIGNLSESPYHHHFTLPVVTPPIVPAVTSVILEYQLIGVMHDVEIGIQSDIFSGTLAM